MVRLVLSKDFDPARVVFNKNVNQINDSYSTRRISYSYPASDVAPAEESRLILQTAKMRAPAGFVNGEKFNQPNKWSQLLSFSGEDKKKLISTFRKAYEALDERVIQEAVARPLEIAAQKFDDDDDEKLRSKLIRKAYSSRIRKSSEEGYSDTLRIDVPWDKDNNRPRDYILFYDANNDEINWDIAKTKGMEVVCLLEVSQIWTSSSNGNFGLTVRLLQMKAYPSSSTKITSLEIQNEVEEDDEVGEESDEIDEDAQEVYVEDDEEIDDLE